MWCTRSPKSLPNAASVVGSVSSRPSSWGIEMPGLAAYAAVTQERRAGSKPSTRVLAPATSPVTNVRRVPRIGSILCSLCARTPAAEPERMSFQKTSSHGRRPPSRSFAHAQAWHAGSALNSHDGRATAGFQWGRRDSIPRWQSYRGVERSQLRPICAEAQWRNGGGREVQEQAMRSGTRLNGAPGAGARYEAYRLLLSVRRRCT